MKKFFVSILTIINLVLVAPISQVLAAESVATTAPVVDVSTPVVVPESAPTNLNTAPLDVTIGTVDKNQPVVVLPDPVPSNVILPSKAAPITPTNNTAPLQMSAMSSGGTVTTDPVQQNYVNIRPTADLFTGALTYQYDFALPEGRNGLTPKLGVAYNSQNLKEGSSFGYGWNISIPYIERLNKNGTDKMYTQNDFTFSDYGELKNVASTSYSLKVDNGDFFSFDFVNNSWVVKDKMGTIFTYGLNAGTRQDNPNDTTQVFRWMLESVQDTNGNTINYTYYKVSGQIYIDTIAYTYSGVTPLYRVEFSRISTPSRKSYASGFLVDTTLLTSGVKIYSENILSREYAINYNMVSIGSPFANINNIVETSYGIGGNTSKTATFQYSDTSTSSNFTESSTFQVPSDVNRLLSSSRPDYWVIVDYNNDSLPDFIKCTALTSTGCDVNLGYEYYKNTGTTWVLDSNQTNLIPGSIFRQPEAYFTDINGDRKVDVVVDSYGAFGNSLQNKVYLHTDTGWVLDSSTTIPQIIGSIDDYQSQLRTEPYTGNWIWSGWRNIDVNGDGSVDYVILALDAVTGQMKVKTVFLNNGNSFTEDTLHYQNNQNVALTLASGNGNYPNGNYVDSNNDGLVDLVKTGYSVPISAVNLNMGINWLPDSPTNYPTDVISGTQIGSYHYNVDLNGDGYVDTLNDGGGTELNQHNDTIAWSPSLSLPNFSTGYYPGNIWTPCCNEQKPLYFVDVNGDGLNDILEIVSRGVDTPVGMTKKVWINNGKIPGLLKNVTYSTGASYDFTYKTSAQYRDSGGNNLNPALPLIVQTVNSITTNDGYGNSGVVTYEYAGGSYYFNTSTDKKFAGFGKITKTDEAGNVTKTYYHQGNTSDTSLGEYDDHISKANKPYRIEQYDNAGNLYNLTVNKWDKALNGNSTFVKLTQTTTEEFDGNGTHKDKAEGYTYDDATGNLTTKTEYGEVNANNDGTFADAGVDTFVTNIAYFSNLTAHILALPSVISVSEGGTTRKQTIYYYDNIGNGVTKGNLTSQLEWVTVTPALTYAITQKTYDLLGNVLTETDPRGNTTTYTYDTTKLYPTTITNALNQSTTYLYNYATGKIKQKTDANGSIWQYTTDGLGRLTEEKAPDPWDLNTKATYTYTDTPLNNSIYERDYLDATNFADTVTYLDGLGRKIQERKEAEGANFSVRDFVYDTRGNLTKESLPYFSVGANKTTPTTDQSLYITSTYDALNRITLTQNAIGNSTNLYDQWKVTTTDQKGIAKDYTKDAFGNLTQVDEHNGASIYSTLYSYDTLGNLTKITDALGNVRTFTYDALSRRLTAQDLHAPSDLTFGTYTYAYDLVGNLTQSIDPKSQTVNYTYDALNRLLTEDNTGTVGVDVTNTYDTGYIGKGRLSHVIAPDFMADFYYDALGGLSQEQKTITGATTQTTYYGTDRQGNQTTIMYPDNEYITYRYNNAGLLERIINANSDTSPIVSNFDYAPNGQVTTQTNANGTVTTNTYDPLKMYRLTNKKTTLPNATKIQDISYTYDNNGNILTANDTTKQNVSYTYDDLNRLLSATSASSIQTFTYNPIGNISANTGTTYTYGGTGYANPHAVTELSVPPTTTLTTTYATSTPTLTNSSTNITNTTSGSPVTKTWSHTVTNASSTIFLTADILQSVAGTGSVASVKWNGASFSPFVSARISNVSSEIWYLKATTTGTKTLYVTVTGATNSIKLGASTFTGLSTPDSSSSATGPSGNPSVTIPVNKDDFVISTLSRYTTTNANTNKSQIYKNTTGSTLGASSYTIATLSGNSTNTYTGSTNTNWSMSSMSFKPIVTKSTVASTTSGISTQTYDNNGNLTNDGVWTHTWNYKNQITQSTKAGATTTYAYDYAGNRIKNQESGVTTYTPNNFYSITGATTTKHIFANGNLVATVEKTGTSTPTVRYVATDHLGGTSAITNQSGALVESTDYNPYGTIRVDNKSTTYNEKRKYAGTEFDSSTGLNYMQARYQNGAQGRFISQDPVFWEKQNLKDPQSLNSYSYANDNPVNLKDPTGRCAGPLMAVCVGAGVGAIGGIANQAYDDSLSGEFGNRGVIGNIQTYGTALMKGAIVGAGTASASALATYYAIGTGVSSLIVGGTAGTLTIATTYGGNALINQPTNAKSTFLDGVVASFTAGTLKSLPQVSGRLPNFGSSAFYTGAHAQRQGAEELFSGSLSTFAQVGSTYASGQKGSQTLFNSPAQQIKNLMNSIVPLQSSNQKK